MSGRGYNLKSEMSAATNSHAAVPSTEILLPERPSLTTARIFAIALLSALVVFLIGAGMDMAILREHESRRLAVELSDALGGLIAGGLVFKLLQYERERRERLRQKIAIIADMNHHVRNALQVISFHAYSTGDQEQLEAVRESMERIQWALKEVLPKL
jgi:hypothetical protein